MKFFTKLQFIVLFIVCVFVIITGSISKDKFIAVSASSSHTIVLRGDGTVWEWGSIGIFSESSPMQVEIKDIKAVSAGFNHCLALKNDGTVWAWGDNRYGELGDGTVSGSLTPVQVKGLSNISKISAGSGYSLALSDNGTVWAWGENDEGQLGDGTYEDKRIPVRVKNLTNVTDIYAESNSFAIKDDSSLWAWGNNAYEYSAQNGYTYGVLLDTTSQTKNYPEPLSLNISNVVQVVQGGQFILILNTDGAVWAWGNNEYGQIGTGINTDYIHTSGPINTEYFTYTPTRVKGIDHVMSITAGNAHALAITNDGTVWAWGDNSVGMLGNGEYSDMRSTPIKINLNNIVDIDAGATHSVAIKSDGTVWAWGDNTYNQVDGSKIYKKPSPIQILGDSSLQNILPSSGSDNKNMDSTAGANSTITLPDTITPFISDDKQNKIYNSFIDLRLVGAAVLILMIMGVIYWVRKKT